MKTLLITSSVIVALAVPALALAQGQQPPPTSRPPTQAPPAMTTPMAPPPVPGQGRQTPPPGAPTVAPQPSQAPGATWNNIKLDVTIVDTLTPAQQVRKVLSLQFADGRQGKVRSQGEQGLINIDAQAQTRADGKTILLHLTVEYRAGAAGSQFTESLSAIVIDGKTIVLSQTADASGDRKVAVEVTATIQKN